MRVFIIIIASNVATPTTVVIYYPKDAELKEESLLMI
jgi:hypothetical protein